MIVWRITRRIHAVTPLDGEGSRRFGSRWNHPGRRLVSTSASLALASLEYFVHVDPDELPGDLVSVKVDVPDTVALERLDPATLPPTWRNYPPPDELANIGDAWLQRNNGLLLLVPSAVIPEENNILINPRHSDFKRLRVQRIAGFEFDARLFASLRK